MAEIGISTHKRCASCGLSRDVNYFARHSKKKDGLQPACRECNRAYQLKWLSENPNYHADWRENNPDRVRHLNAEGKRRLNENHPGKLPARERARYQSQKEGWRAKGHARRVRAKENGGQFTADDVRKIKQGQRNKCWWCSKRLVTFHIDHRIPLSRGGKNDASNIVVSCPTCNLSRGAKLPWEGPLPRLI